MTVSQTLRFMLKKYSSGGDPHPNRAEFNTMIDSIENNAAMYSQGITAARPTAGKRGRWYWDETAQRAYYDDGTTWRDTNPNGGGGAGAPVVPGAAAVEGIAARSARADHTHALPLATAAVDGAMPKADKSKLDAATDAATASTVMRRDSSGRASVGTPTLTGHATTKGYVDGQITAIGNAAADYADGAITAAPNATGTAAGKMSSADKTKLDAATSSATVSTLMFRDAAGRSNAQSLGIATAPANANDAARKDYVDGQVTGAKTYADNAVAAAPNATGTTAGKMSAADKAKLDAADVANTPSTLVRRDTNGAVNVSGPTIASHATRKDYVDTAVNGAKTYADNAVSDAPNATGTAAGKMSAADKTKLDAATQTSTPSTLVYRNSSGTAAFAYATLDNAPTLAAHSTRKDYVDAQVTSAKTYTDSEVGPLPLGIDGLVQDSTLSASRTATDASLGEVTINVVAGRNYVMTVALDWYGETAGNLGVAINFRRGGTTGITGTLLASRVVWSAPVATSSAAAEVSVVYKATTTGPLRFSASSARVAGTSAYRLTNNEVRVTDAGAAV
jgi:hypothetical protein